MTVGEVLSIKSFFVEASSLENDDYRFVLHNFIPQEEWKGVLLLWQGNLWWFDDWTSTDFCLPLYSTIQNLKKTKKKFGKKISLSKWHRKKIFLGQKNRKSSLIHQNDRLD